MCRLLYSGTKKKVTLENILSVNNVLKHHHRQITHTVIMKIIELAM